MRATILPYAIGQCYGKGVYCSLRTAFEVFLIFVTQLYSCLYNYDAMFRYWQEGSMATGILPTPSSSLSSFLVGSNRDLILVRRCTQH